MSMVQKEKDYLWTSATLEHCKAKTVGFDACGTDMTIN